eukprot:TRINITY_DN2181_c0_g1_i1.p1 TRINITY_DN2181_c0_g1~~TRINITY_DN2181_c0_g1_i1.p1  ORF type:complete len:1776 (+),score=216.43 TRINITY_DN2181_c0_g1_i1:102-5429(+)
MKLALTGIVSILAILATRVVANTWYLNPAGSDLSGNGTLSNPYYSINRALNGANDGDVLVLGAGEFIFSEPQTINVSILLIGNSSNSCNTRLTLSDSALGPVVSILGVNAVFLQDLCINYTVTSNTQVTSIGLAIENVQNASLTNVQIVMSVPETSAFVLSGAPTVSATNISNFFIRYCQIDAALRASMIQNLEIRDSSFKKSYFPQQLRIIDVSSASFLLMNSSIEGAVIMNNTATTIRASSFSNGRGSDSAGGCLSVIFTNRPIEIQRSVFSQCSSTLSGGAISISNSSSFASISETRFYGNYAAHLGGAIHVTGELTELRIDNCTFLNNSIVVNESLNVASSGSAVFSLAALFNVTNSLVRQNQIQQQLYMLPLLHAGGAFSASGRSVLRHVTFDSNVGGALRQEAASTIFVMSDCVFVNNVADYFSPFGGAGLILQNSVATISNVSFSKNVFRSNLGAAALLIAGSDSSATASDCSFVENGPFNTVPVAAAGGTLTVRATSTEVLVDNCQFMGNGVNSGSGALFVSEGTVLLQGSSSRFWNNSISNPAVSDAQDIKIYGTGHVVLDIGIGLSERDPRWSNIVIDGPSSFDPVASITFRPTAFGGTVATFLQQPNMVVSNGLVNCSLVRCELDAESSSAAGSISTYVVGPLGVHFNSLVIGQTSIVNAASADGTPKRVTSKAVLMIGNARLVLNSIDWQVDVMSKWEIENGIANVTIDRMSNVTVSGDLLIKQASVLIWSETNNDTFPRMLIQGSVFVQDSVILLLRSRVEIVGPAIFTWQKTRKPEATNWLDVIAVQLVPSTPQSTLLMAPSEIIFNHTLQGPILNEQVPFIAADSVELIRSQVIYRPAKYSWPRYPEFAAVHGYYGPRLTVLTTSGPATCGDRPDFPYFICDTTLPETRWSTRGSARFSASSPSFPFYDLKVPVEISVPGSAFQFLSESHVYFREGAFVNGSGGCVNFLGVPPTTYSWTVEFNASNAINRTAQLSPISGTLLSPDAANTNSSSTESVWEVAFRRQLFQMPQDCFTSILSPLIFQRNVTISYVDVSGSLRSVTGCSYFDYEMHNLTTLVTIRCAPAPPALSPTAVSPIAPDSVGSSSAGAIAGAIIAVAFVAAIIVAAVLFLRRRKAEISPVFAEAVELDEKGTPRSAGPAEFADAIPIREVSFMQELGRGSWGVVSLAIYKGAFVAVKRVRADASGAQLATLVEEANMMAALKNHRNLVKFIGVCSETSSFGLVMEFCPRGSLSSYLRGKKADSPLPEYDMFKFAYGALEGMVMLATDGLVHRDLAARNILLDENLFSKVSDFGSSRRFGETDEALEGNKQDDNLGPIKWQPPEVLNDQAYSEKSDVWSFGCTLLEIVTGREPYAGFAGNILQLVQQIKAGSLNPLSHLQKTGDISNLPEWAASVLPSCFNATPASRPSFREIRFHINQKARHWLNAYEAELDELESVLSPSHYSPVPAAPWTGAQPSSLVEEAENAQQKGIIDTAALERLGKLGSGAYGTVYLGKFQGQYVAIKALELSTSTASTVLREVEVMGAVPQHRNIVQLFGIVKESDRINIIMEFAPKGSCEDYVAASEGKISEALLFKWALSIARGMAHLTANRVIHRDLSARNVLLDSQLEPKIADFGLGRTVLDPQQESQTRTDVGPLRWFSPECFDLKYSEKTDVWAYGCTLIELATGKLPFPNRSVADVYVAVHDQDGTPMDDLPSGLPSWLLKTMQKCFARNAKDRATFVELVAFMETQADSIQEIREAEAAIQRRRNKRAGTILGD